MTAQGNITISGIASPNGKFNSSYQGGGSIGTLISQADWTTGGKVPANYGSSTWDLYTSPAAGFATNIVGDALQFDYGDTAGDSNDLNCYIDALNLKDIYIEFYAAITTTNKHGNKFCKVFGQKTLAGVPNPSGDNYSNTTMQLDYSSGPTLNGRLYLVQFGDGGGTAIANDIDRAIALSGSGSNVGRAPAPSILTPQNKEWARTDWGTGFHRFRIRVKFNDGTSSGNEVANGAYYLEIDGNVYVNATGLFNRHYTNSPIQRIGFAGYTQGNGGAFSMSYRMIKVSTGGFMS